MCIRVIGRKVKPKSKKLSFIPNNMIIQTRAFPTRNDAAFKSPHVCHGVAYFARVLTSPRANFP